ncbi:hypothetical protein BD289DRAFT_222821 [Coniella lustricola]|uniref:Uncharacterized protein n=1 Tax=Coniella lustricola TaxID=2025994 RepID=A0A2T3AB55_9PEZI|nr:hypothetical protein BD289DRAFT_222821 [Coniella lustricola]
MLDFIQVSNISTMYPDFVFEYLNIFVTFPLDNCTKIASPSNLCDIGLLQVNEESGVYLRRGKGLRFKMLACAARMRSGSALLSQLRQPSDRLGPFAVVDMFCLFVGVTFQKHSLTRCIFICKDPRVAQSCYNPELCGPKAANTPHSLDAHQEDRAHIQRRRCGSRINALSQVTTDGSRSLV